MQMGDFIPPGRLSAYQHGGKTFQVQTEYAPRPHPRVTTSVVLDGRMVHKVDRAWEAEVESEQTRKDLESCLAEQHRQALDLVRVRADEYLNTPPPPKSTPGYAAPSFRDSMVEVLGALPIVTGVYEFDEKGKTVFNHHFRDIHAEWDREFIMLAELVALFPNIIRVGSFCHGCCWFPAENVMLFTVQNRRFGVLTESAGSIEEIWREFPELYEAVHD